MRRSKRPYLTLSHPQQWDSNDVIWSPSIECKLATPPASRGLSPANVSDTTLSPTQPLNRTTSISGTHARAHTHLFV